MSRRVKASLSHTRGSLPHGERPVCACACACACACVCLPKKWATESGLLEHLSRRRVLDY